MAQSKYFSHRATVFFVVFILLVLYVPALIIVAQDNSRPAGTREKLSVGELFIPDNLQLNDGKANLVVHLHGTPERSERNLAKSTWSAAAITVSLNGLSGVYTRQFTPPDVFLQLVDEAAAKIAAHFKQPSIKFKRVAMTSFSAGFGGVRQLLKSDECYQRIDDLVMADSIYAGYSEPASERKVDPELMAGFLRFARDAVAGRKTLVISNCQLQPDGYASTGETADYLIRELGLSRQPEQKEWAPSWHCASRCEQGRLHIFGFDGTEGADHMRHLLNLGDLLKIAVKQ